MRLLLLLPLVLLACGDAPPAPPAAPTVAPLPDAEVPSFEVGALMGPANPDASPRWFSGDTTGRAAWARERFEEMIAEREFATALAATDTWQDAHRLVREATPADAYPRHGTAVAMLRRLLRAPDSPEATEAIGWYTQALVAQGSPEGSVLLRALRRLDGHWDDDRRRGAARSAADRLGAVFAKVAGCVGCSVEEALAGMWPQRRATSENRLYDLEAVHQQLMALATEGTPMP